MFFFMVPGLLFFFFLGGRGGGASEFSVRPRSLGGHGTLTRRIKRPGWVGEGAPKKFYKGGLLLEVQTLPFLFTFFNRKDNLFI